MAKKDNKKDNKNNSSKPSNSKLIVRISCMVLAGILSVVLAVFLYGMLADHKSPILRLIVKTPVLNLLITPEKRGRAMIYEGIIALKDEKQREILLSEPAKFNSKLVFKLSGADTFGEVKIEFDTSGKYKKNLASTDNMITISSGGLKAKVNADAVFAEDAIYFKLYSVPKLLLNLFSDYAGNMDANDVSDDRDGGISYGDLDILALANTLNQMSDDWFRIELELFGHKTVNRFFDTFVSLVEAKSPEYNGTAELNNKTAYHFTYEFTQEELKWFIQEVTAETEYEAYFGLSEDLDLGFVAEMFAVDLWITENADAIKFSVSLSSEDLEKNGYPGMTLAISFELFDFGSANTVNTPDLYLDWFDYISN